MWKLAGQRLNVRIAGLPPISADFVAKRRVF
jgi:hypothetical protein